VGTFARSERAEDAAITPGDGKIAGRGMVDGRPVSVAGDDLTVKRGSSSDVGGRKLHRLFEQALEDGNPLVYFGETAGARIPDLLGSEGFTRVSSPIYQSRRGRRVPLVTMIVGQSYGGSSFLSTVSDLAIQVRGSCMAVTSPQVIEIATSEQITEEDLGGVDVHAKITGQIDLGVDDEQTGFDAVRQFLSYLPSNAWSPPPVAEPVEPEPGPSLRELVPLERRRAYDMRRLVRRIVDGDSFFELRPMFGRSLVTGLARIGGHPVGVIANQPMQQAGALNPQACDKATRLICLCDAFGLPVVFLHDTPGFVVGTKVEHEGLLYKAMLLQQAIALARVPRLAVVVRKSYGLANLNMSGNDMEADLLCAWPTAEISFMDPDVGANVIYGRELAGLSEEDRPARRQQRAEELAADIDPFGAAGLMNLDEIIEPDETRDVLLSALARVARRPFRPGSDGVLATWPMCW
jgi:acetyl-CoA carboxylase carboxyltransferase component